MNSMEALKDHLPEIEAKLGYEFSCKEYLALAFVHRSFFNEHRDTVFSTNERLEFLGDSVWGLIISDFLYSELPEQEEGQLSSLRSQIVEASHCAALLHSLSLAPYVLLGKGERMNDGRGRETILADLFEAIIGAIYLDGGLEKARHFVLSHFKEKIQALLVTPFRNWKAELQDYSQKKYQKPPLYKIVKEEGPDHSKTFEVVVVVAGQEMGIGRGSSKKEAEQSAAEDAWGKLHG